MNNCDNILNWMKEQAEHKIPIDPLMWLEAAEKLNAMKEEETDKAIDLRQKVASLRLGFLREGKSAVYARMAVETMDEYKEMCRQHEKLGRIEEAIRLAKVHSRLKNDQLRSGL